MKRSLVVGMTLWLAVMIVAHAYGKSTLSGKAFGFGEGFGFGRGTGSVGVLQSPDPDEVKKVPIYVTNFELDVAPEPPPRRPPARTNVPGKPPTEPPDAHKLAGYVVDLMASKLVAALRKEGYTAQRLGAEDERPSSGVEIRGIFTEIDEENHWRRAVIRSGEDSGKMNAMVAVQNLARPEQALYEIAPLPGNDDGPGPVITLSSYLPLQKYEVDKDGTDVVYAKTAAQVVSDLTDLLVSNPAASQE